MRYTDRVTFVTESPGGYNPETGNHEEATQTTETLPCNISPLGTNRTQELFGSITVRVDVVRLQRPYHASFDYVIIDGKRMNVKRDVPHRRKTVFYVEGVSL